MRRAGRGVSHGTPGWGSQEPGLGGGGDPCGRADAGEHLREGQREEASKAANMTKELGAGEGARRHFAARTLEGTTRRALAAEAAVRPVGAGAPVAADARDAASGLRVQLAVFA